MRCSTSPAERAGCRSITAGASASGTPCTRARSSSPMARRRCGFAWSGCSRTTRASASPVTRTPATRRPARPPPARASCCRWRGSVLSARFRPYHVPLFIAKHLWYVARRRPVLVHFEVTERCNARCAFCDFWKTPASARQYEIDSFADAARFFNPMLVTWTGGEPLLRRDLEAMVAAVDRVPGLRYTTLITHGGMLTPERASALWDAGVHQFNISLDYLDGRHDEARGIPGLTARIFATVDGM